MSGDVLKLQGLRLTKRGTDQTELNEVLKDLLEYLNKDNVCQALQFLLIQFSNLFPNRGNLHTSPQRKQHQPHQPQDQLLRVNMTVKQMTPALKANTWRILKRTALRPPQFNNQKGKKVLLLYKKHMESINAFLL